MTLPKRIFITLFTLLLFTIALPTSPVLAQDMWRQQPATPQPRPQQASPGLPPEPEEDDRLFPPQTQSLSQRKRQRRPSTAQQSPSWYLGSGLGMAALKPNVSNSTFTLSDDSDTAFSVFAGFYVTPHSRIECLIHSLGSASLSSNNTNDSAAAIDYQAYAVDGLFDFMTFNDNTLVIFASLGLANVAIDSQLILKSNNEVGLKAGVGIEHRLNNSYGARLTTDFFSGDVNTVTSVSFLKYFQ